MPFRWYITGASLKLLFSFPTWDWQGRYTGIRLPHKLSLHPSWLHKIPRSWLWLRNCLQFIGLIFGRKKRIHVIASSGSFTLWPAFQDEGRGTEETALLWMSQLWSGPLCLGSSSHSHRVSGLGGVEQEVRHGTFIFSLGSGRLGHCLVPWGQVPSLRRMVTALFTCSRQSDLFCLPCDVKLPCSCAGTPPCWPSVEPSLQCLTSAVIPGQRCTV